MTGISHTPSKSIHRNRGTQLIRAVTDVFRVSDWTLSRVDPDGLRYVATLTVWVQWFIVATSFVQLVYRPAYGYELPRFAPYALVLLLLAASTGYVHYRLVSNRTITWRWIFAIGALDVTLVSAAAVIGGGFSHYFFHLLYYPVLAGFAVFFTSFRFNMAMVTVVAIVYLVISLFVGDGIDLAARAEKPLFARIVVMYAVVAIVNLISRFERTRWRAAVERERALQRERVELSQSIHDTTAQSAYMIGLGIDAAKQLAGDSNEELTARLEATSRLSKLSILQLRRPIDMGSIFDGRELGRTLESHVATFSLITSVPADLVQNGEEPPLSVEARGLLFSIAHNALTNAFRHAGASRVLLELDFQKDYLRLSVSDDGAGLPGDYAERGHGFANMRADAERLGGRLAVEPRGPAGGASVTCVIPLDPNRLDCTGEEA